MATAAQTEANRRNAQRSTGPTTDEEKDRVRRNAFKHGMTARTVMPVLSQEDPRQLEERTDRWTNDLQPRNAIEYDLVVLAARLAHAIERGERIETAHLAGRVRAAARQQTQQVSPRRLEQVQELGRKLLYVTAPPTNPNAVPYPPCDDDPAVFVRKLEETVEGCCWLLERWAEYRNMLDRKSSWETPVLLRFIRLQGKPMIEAAFDPALNSIVVAWNVLQPGSAKKHWIPILQRMPDGDPAFRDELYFHEIASRPKDEAWAVLSAVVDRHVGRLKELLAHHQASAAAEDADWADRAALDCSTEFERHRRYQSAKTRELLRTLDTRRKLRNADFGMGNGEKADGKCRMANGRWQMADGKWQMANDECRVADGDLQVAEDGCRVAEDGCRVAEDGCEVRLGGCGDRER